MTGALKLQKRNLSLPGTYARDFLKKYYENEKILVAATETYCNELRKAGLNITDQAEDDVDCVLCAYDTELTYEKLVQVCQAAY